MEPLFKDGDRVLIKRTRFYLPGDIIVFKDPSFDRFIIHRLGGFAPSKEQGLRLVTYSEASGKFDIPTPRSDVLGRVSNYRISFIDRIKSLWRFVVYGIPIGMKRQLRN